MLIGHLPAFVIASENKIILVQRKIQFFCLIGKISQDFLVLERLGRRASCVMASFIRSESIYIGTTLRAT